MNRTFVLPFPPPLPSLATQIELAAYYAATVREAKERGRIRNMTRDQKDAYDRRMALYDLMTEKKQTVAELSELAVYSKRKTADYLDQLAKERTDIKRQKFGSGQTAPILWWREQE